MNDLALASKVRAALAQDPYTSNLEFEVASRGGSISIRGDCAGETEAIQRVVGAIAGITGLTVDTGAVPVLN